jgi:ADP-ribose pyrophosphatase
VTNSAASVAGSGSMRDAHIIETEIILPAPKRFVREALAMPDGTRIDWYYVDAPSSVMVIPITARGSLVLVRQYRHNLKRDTLELPAGTLDKDEKPEEAALRELKEETGHAMPDDAALRPLGSYYSLPSETNKYTHYYIAEPVMRVGPPAGDAVIEKYFDMSVIEIPVDEAYDAIGSLISGIETVGALLLAREHIHVR